MGFSRRVPAFFRRIALKGWSKSPYFTYSSSYVVLRRWLIARLSVRDEAILSIGCGSGELERDMLKPGHRVMGLDICYEMLQSAQKRGIKNVVQADALQLPFASSSFDLVMFPESLGYFDLDLVLPGAARVLKARGRLIITAYSTSFASDDIYNRTSVETLASGLSRAGFRISDRSLLTVSTRRVVEVESERDAHLIYILARKNRVR